MTRVAVIGGSGLTRLERFRVKRRVIVRTPYGEPSGPLVHGSFGGYDVIFLARHGQEHTIPPHLVNYRANLWSLKDAGVRTVVAVAAVGAIRSDLQVGSLVFPDQIIDYTYSREHTFVDGSSDVVMHIDFTDPYCGSLRGVFIDAAGGLGLPVPSCCTYAATQGPRLESAAEIDRIESDGGDIVGMTGMPETGLAKELNLCYATIGVVANAAAGRGEGPITADTIQNTLEHAMENVHALLKEILRLLPKLECSNADPAPSAARLS